MYLTYDQLSLFYWVFKIMAESFFVVSFLLTYRNESALDVKKNLSYYWILHLDI